MLRLALFFFVLAILSGLFGYGGIAASFAGAAEVLFYVFVVLFVLTLLANLVTGKKTHLP